MSAADRSRRTAFEVTFDGVDITGSMAQYLLSLTYTDNEEDEADDLQIKLQDRDNIWTEQWLNEAVDAAASDGVGTGSGTGAKVPYVVTPKIGLNVRTGPGVSYKRLGALTCGTMVMVNSIENNWALIDYGSGTAYVCATYIKPTGAAAGTSADVSVTSTGFLIGAVIVRQNWNGDGRDDLLDCGTFELDDIKGGGPANTIAIKGTSLPYTAQIRQTKKNKAWESYTLSGIAQEMALANGMTLMYLVKDDPSYARVEQFNESDIAFLSRLCHDAGISLKATNKMLVLFDQAEYEAKDPVRTVRRGDKSYIKYDLSIGTANKKYQSCRVSYVSPTNGRRIEGIAYVADYKKDAKNNQQLEMTAKVSSAAEAKALAAKRLRLYNKYQRTVSFTFPGDPSLVAGSTIEVANWGAFNGRYIIKKAVHTISRSGYTTKITCRRALEGY